MGIFERVCRERGLDEGFLSPKYEALADPFALPDMEKAVERIIKAAENGEKILIYGDYDVDGVTASTVMHDALELAGAGKIEVMLPNRFSDGYGMSEKVVAAARDRGVALVITVDCGSGNKEIIKGLLEYGIDTVVTDHHECPEELPEAVAVVNPKRKDAEVGSLRDLAGVGVAFMVAKALVARGKIAEGQEKWLLDLVMLGTMADAMKLSRDNRILTYFGLLVLKKTRRVGLKELIKTAKLAKIDTEAILFRICPRLNAAGRMKSAEIALKLLTTRDGTEAASLAEEVEELNNERREIQMKAAGEIEAAGVGEDKVIVVKGDWHEGVLGIIAGKLVEKYKRPAFVLTEVDGVLKGSGRSFGEFNLALALSECQNFIIGGGGHAEACGVKLERDKLGDFSEAMNKYYKSLKLEGQEKYLLKKADVITDELKDFSAEMVEKMMGLEPYGPGNTEPVFLLEKVLVTEVRKMGAEGQHLSVTVAGVDGGTMRLIAFFAPEKWLSIREGERIDVWVRVIKNEFRGLVSVEGQIERLEIAEE